MGDLGELGEIAASAMAVDEQSGRARTPEAVPVVGTPKEETPVQVSVSADAPASSTDGEDVVEETIAPGTAR
ncbi:hypothetical protein GX50_06347 [[Emmonsia] crescens]|uniref:Uncharacterized protein n=1 Tax=[Emmonsia] crescens TaxID=73230 RepID=A0A2B7ZD07_9EURO|nr:hypothetical protein GX50_06347 [Emmonsia crescens]